MSENITKFITFGCWNNLNKKETKLEQVMEHMKSYLDTEQPGDETRLLVISGDNYYPQKESKTETKEKRKIVRPDLLDTGFSLLPNNIAIDMVMGNHDYESNRGKREPELFIQDGDITERREEQDCFITKREKQTAPPKVDLQFFKSRVLKNRTLLLMIDTTLYSTDIHKLWGCYSEMFSSDTNITSPEDLAAKQNDLIYKAVYENRAVVNKIVIVGHHPILYIKRGKKGPDNFASDIRHPQNTVELRTQASSALRNVVKQDIPYFVDVLKTIYNTARPSTKFYYLCADYHSYQRGRVSIPIEREGGSPGRTMHIEQYIAGTGGTKLDEPLADNTPRTYEYEEGQKYKFSKNINDWGYLVCRDRRDKLECEFVAISDPIIPPSDTIQKTPLKNTNTKSKRTKLKKKSTTIRRYR